MAKYNYNLNSSHKGDRRKGEYRDCHKLVTNHEVEWESYFNFNLATRGYLDDNFIRKEGM